MKVCILLIPALLALASGGDGNVLFQDHFDGKLQSGWKWVREDPSEWRIAENQLQVRSQAGRIWGGNDAKNLLLVDKEFESQNVAASVSVAHEPKEKYEQAGPLWYLDDDNFVKLISEQIDGKMHVVTAREIEGRGKVVGKFVVPKANLQLRLKVESTRVTGQWRLEDADAWSDAGTCDFQVQGKPRFGLFTQNGPPDQVRWVRFDNFLIVELKPGS
jgi:regulation of enolase protein 1 (concanavalin A-like superfamily)